MAMIGRLRRKERVISRRVMTGAPGSLSHDQIPVDLKARSLKLASQGLSPAPSLIEPLIDNAAKIGRKFGRQEWVSRAVGNPDLAA
jgi:hypothetical protein